MLSFLKWLKNKFVKSKKIELILPVDSTVGPIIEPVETPEQLNHNELNLIIRKDKSEKEAEKILLYDKFIICNGNKVNIEWNKVVLWTDFNGLKIPKSHYKEQKTRNPKQFVIHYDVCQTSHSCFEVLKERGLSVHFLIDGDGTIYQLCDTKEVCWHAKGINTTSVGVEICNPVFVKHNDIQEKKWGSKRPVVQSCVVHNRETGPLLGFYPSQIQACKALIKTLARELKIELKYPSDSEGKLFRGLNESVVNQSFKGIIGHFNVVDTKVDPGDFPIDLIVNEIIDNLFQEIFPI